MNWTDNDIIVFLPAMVLGAGVALFILGLVKFNQSSTDDVEIDPSYIYDTVRYDEYTLEKTYAAIRGNDHISEDDATSIILRLQNAGILFRERA